MLLMLLVIHIHIHREYGKEVTNTYRCRLGRNTNIRKATKLMEQAIVVNRKTREKEL